MFRKYVTVSLRRLARHKGSTFINVFGLALGLSCSLLIGLFIRDELSYDRFYPKADNIYRITTEMSDTRSGGELERLASTFMAVGPAVRESIPEARSAVRIQGNHLTSTLLSAGERQFYEDNVFAADAGIFEMFDIELLRGDATIALKRPNTVVLTAEMARKFFDDADPLGKTISFYGKDYEVTGVMRALPANTHLQLDVISSMATADAEDWWKGREWGLLGFYTYLHLETGADPVHVGERIAEVAVPIDPESPSSFRLQPLTDIHLRSELSGELSPGSDIRTIWLFGSIAVLVLLIACINYMNLATALASRRASEIGVRKAVGAGGRQIAGQFLVESVLIALAALLMGTVLIELALPSFNNLTGKSLSVDYSREGLLMALVALGSGLMAGSYPSAILSRFRPVQALRGAASGSGRDRGFLRRALVVFQFTTSIALITATIVVQRQLDYVQEERLGFEKEHLVTLHQTARLGENYGAFKEALLTSPDVNSVTTTTNVPGQRIYNEYGMRPPEESGLPQFYLTYSSVDFDFVDVMGLEIVQGRNLDPVFGSDMEKAILINEATARKMGWDEPIGKELFGREVVGLVADYLTMSSAEEVRPGSFVPMAGVDRYVVLRLAPGAVSSGVLDHVEQAWNQFVDDAPLDFSFVDGDIEALYRAEERLGRVFISFSLIAVLIACLGLFGLAAFAAERRTKEIGVRKVLGASVSGIVGLLSREFVALVLVSLLIGGPLAFFAMNRWLEDYVYRIELGWGTPLLAGGIALVIALGTVSWRALRAATANPVESLRYE